MDDLELSDQAEGVSLRVRVSPGAARRAVLGVHAGALKVSVAAPAERGMANLAMRELIAESLDLPLTRVRLVAGATSRDKRVEVRGLGAATIRQRLGRALDRR
jgi:uncharacterized protein (TIGR00251 family)